METTLSERVDSLDLTGQMTLPNTGMKRRSQAMSSSKHEDFCQEYVRLGDNGRAAYRAAMNPDVSDKTAEQCASRLLRSDKIQARIAEIRAELRKRWMVSQDDVLEFHGRVLKTDRRKFFDDNGRRIPVHELPDDLAAIVDLEATFSKEYGVVMLPAVASKAKSAESLARILGLDKQKMEVTGKDGGAIEANASVTFYMPGNGRD